MSSSLKVLLLLILYSLHAIDCNGSVKDDQIKKLVHDWSDAHSPSSLNRFNSLFAPYVMFYGRNLSKEECIKKKYNLLTKDVSFKQQIVSDITVRLYESGIMKCDFMKEVVSYGKKKNFPSYLLIEKINGQLLITGESDLITDSNINNVVSLGKEITDESSTGKIGSFLGGTNTIYLFALFVAIAAALLWWRKSVRSNIVSHSINVEVNNTVEISSFEKGYEFEKYVVQKFDKKYFTLWEWRSDKIIAGIYPKSNENPDLEFKFTHKEHTIKFAVECKFREKFNNGFVELGKPDQINRYKNYKEKVGIEVYVVLGIGGMPDNPEELYLFSVDKLNSPKMHANTLKRYHKSMNSKFFFNTEINSLT